MSAGLVAPVNQVTERQRNIKMGIDTNPRPATITIFRHDASRREQSPGASLNRAEKIEIARALEQLGVDVIEAGFPITSPDDFDAVRAIADMVKESAVCGLARCLAKTSSGPATQSRTPPRRVHVFCATSEIPPQVQAQAGPDEIIKMSIEGVQAALQ